MIEKRRDHVLVAAHDRFEQPGKARAGDIRIGAFLEEKIHHIFEA